MSRKIIFVPELKLLTVLCFMTVQEVPGNESAIRQRSDPASLRTATHVAESRAVFRASNPYCSEYVPQQMNALTLPIKLRLIDVPLLFERCHQRDAILKLRTCAGANKGNNLHNVTSFQHKSPEFSPLLQNVPSGLFSLCFSACQVMTMTKLVTKGDIYPARSTSLSDTLFSSKKSMTDEQNIKQFCL